MAKHHRQCQIAIATFASLDIKKVIAMMRKIIEAALYHQTGDKTHVAIKRINEQEVLRMYDTSKATASKTGDGNIFICLHENGILQGKILPSQSPMALARGGALCVLVVCSRSHGPKVPLPDGSRNGPGNGPENGSGNGSEARAAACSN